MSNFLKYLSLTAAAAVLMSGCSSTQSDEKKTEAAVAAIGEDAVAESVRMGRESGEVLLKALAENNFAMAKDLPTGSGNETLTQEKFETLVSKVITPNGGIAEHAYLGDMARGINYRRMLWKVNFQKPTKDLENTDVFFEVWVGRLDGQLRIVGFQFHP